MFFAGICDPPKNHDLVEVLPLKGCPEVDRDVLEADGQNAVVLLVVGPLHRENLFVGPNDRRTHAVTYLRRAELRLS